MDKKTVLITGSSSGIGKEMALRLAEEGYLVFAGVRHNLAKQELQSLHENIYPIYLNVVNEKSIDEAFKTVNKKTKTLNAIINNAGIVVAGPMEYLPVSKIIYQFDVNTFGALRVVHKFLPMLKEGKIINISSMASTGVFPFIAPYCASKRALDILFNSMSIELKNKNIKIVSIKPSAVKTPIWDKSISTNRRILEELPREQSKKYEKEFRVLERNAEQNNGAGIEVEEVTELVCKVLGSKNPCPSYTVGSQAFWVDLFSKLPQWLINMIVKSKLNSELKTV